MKPLIEEGDIVVLLEPDHQKVYYVEKKEDIVYDYTYSSAIAANTLGSFTEISNLEPPQKSFPEVRMYQWRCGIDVGMAYVELLSGQIRRTIFRQKVPTSSSPYVGYFDENASPLHSPRFEFFLRYNEKPAFAIYNKWGFGVTPRLHFTGRHLKMFDLSDNRAYERLAYTGLRPSDWQQIRMEALAGKRPRRLITAYGVE